MKCNRKLTRRCQYRLVISCIKLAWILLCFNMVVYAGVLDKISDWAKGAVSSTSQFFEKDLPNFVTKDVKNTFESALNEVERTGKKWSDVIADRFKDTKVTRALAYAMQRGGLESYIKILQASEKTALAALTAAERAAQGALTASEGFLQGVEKVSTASLKGVQETATGVLTAAEKAGTGILQGGQLVLENTLNQFNVSCIHYDGSLQDLIQLNLGNVEIRAKLITDMTLKTNLNLKDPLESIASVSKDLAGKMKNILIDPISQALGKPFDVVVSDLKEQEKMVNQAAAQITALQKPDLKQYELELENNMKIVMNFTEHQRSLLEGEIIVDLQNAQKYIVSIASLTYDQILTKLKTLPAYDERRKLLENELLQKLQAMRGEKVVFEEAEEYKF